MPNRTQLNGSHRSARQRVGTEKQHPRQKDKFRIFFSPLFLSHSRSFPSTFFVLYQMLGVANA
jgi:hypothetical protein